MLWPGCNMKIRLPSNQLPRGKKSHYAASLKVLFKNTETWITEVERGEPTGL